MVLHAPRVKGRAASRTTVSATEVLCNRKCLLTVAAENGVGLAFILAPDYCLMTGQFFMTLDAGIKSVAAFESHSHNIEFRVVVLTLTSLIDADAVDYHLTKSSSAALPRPRLGFVLEYRNHTKGKELRRAVSVQRLVRLASVRRRNIAL